MSFIRRCLARQLVEHFRDLGDGRLAEAPATVALAEDLDAHTLTYAEHLSPGIPVIGHGSEVERYLAKHRFQLDSQLGPQRFAVGCPPYILQVEEFQGVGQARIVLVSRVHGTEEALENG